MEIKVASLGSGSSGNSTLIEFGELNFLVDIGFSYKQLSSKLQKLGKKPEDVNAVFITHEHSDHIKGLKTFTKKHDTPIYLTAMNREVVSLNWEHKTTWKLFEAGQSFTHGSVKITSVAIPHDAVEPVAYTFQYAGTQIGIITDLGYVPQRVGKAISIKQRIASRHGHLSNEQTLDLIQKLIPHGLKQVALGHLSSDCNCPNILEKTLQPVNEDIAFYILTQENVSSWMVIPTQEKAPATFVDWDNHSDHQGALF